MSFSLSSAERKQERMFNPSDNPVLSDRMYNLTIGGVILYGVFINALMCIYLTPFIMTINPIVLLIGYMVLAIAGSVIAFRSDQPLISFLGYNMVVIPMGAVLTVCLQGYDPGLIFQAFFLTAVITVVMLLLAAAVPALFAGLGRMLFTVLLGTLMASLICSLLHLGTIVVSWILAVVFSLYIGYDWVKAQRYVHTLDNAIDSALDIYLDIINLFLRILLILSRNND